MITNKDIQDRIVGINEKGEPILKLEPATEENIKKQSEILTMAKSGKINLKSKTISVIDNR